MLFVTVLQGFNYLYITLQFNVLFSKYIDLFYNIIIYFIFSENVGSGVIRWVGKGVNISV